MTISIVDSKTVLSNTMATMPTHQAGDVLLGLGYNDAQTTLVALPTGWINRFNIAVGGAGYVRIAYKYASNSSETSGTWTNADQLFMLSMRGDPNTILFPNWVSTNNATGTVINYAGQVGGTFQDNASDQALLSWVVSRNAANVLTAPTGLTEQIAATDASNFVTQVCRALSRTTVFSTQNVNVANSALWRSIVLSIVESPIFGATGASASDPIQHPLLG